MVQIMKKFLLALAAVALLSAACSRRADNEAAVRQAIERYLASRPNLNMSGMDMLVSGIKIRDGKAEADVTFRSKTDAQASFSTHYTLTRRDRKWEVQPQSGGHGGMMPPPSSHGGSDLPTGHPPAGSLPGSSELPPGHPPVKSK